MSASKWRIVPVAVMRPRNGCLAKRDCGAWAAIVSRFERDQMEATHAASMKESRLLIALLILTFVTGMVDAVSFLGLGHVFTANMTGNVVLLGFAVAGTE